MPVGHLEAEDVANFSAEVEAVAMAEAKAAIIVHHQIEVTEMSGGGPVHVSLISGVMCTRPRVTLIPNAEHKRVLPENGKPHHRQIGILLILAI